MQASLELGCFFYRYFKALIRFLELVKEFIRLVIDRLNPLLCCHSRGFLLRLIRFELHAMSG